MGWRKSGVFRPAEEALVITCDVCDRDIGSQAGRRPCEPLHTWHSGTPRRGPAGEALEGVYRESYWMGRLMEEPQLSSAQMSVESELLRTLAHLCRSQDFLEQLHAAGGVAELYVTLFAREDFRLELSAQSLALLGRLGLAVALDVHPQPSHGLSHPQAS